MLESIRARMDAWMNGWMDGANCPSLGPPVNSPGPGTQGAQTRQREAPVRPPFPRSALHPTGLGYREPGPRMGVQQSVSRSCNDKAAWQGNQKEMQPKFHSLLVSYHLATQMETPYVAVYMMGKTLGVGLYSGALC